MKFTKTRVAKTTSNRSLKARSLASEREQRKPRTEATFHALVSRHFYPLLDYYFEAIEKRKVKFKSCFQYSKNDRKKNR